MVVHVFSATMGRSECRRDNRRCPKTSSGRTVARTTFNPYDRWRMAQTFDVALRRLEWLLRHEHWPERVIWVDLDQVFVFPLTAKFIRLPRHSDHLAGARRTFDSARDRGLPIEVYGIGCHDGTTYVTVRPIEELAQGEAMFRDVDG